MAEAGGWTETPAAVGGSKRRQGWEWLAAVGVGAQPKQNKTEEAEKEGQRMAALLDAGEPGGGNGDSWRLV